MKGAQKSTAGTMPCCTACAAPSSANSSHQAVPTGNPSRPQIDQTQALKNKNPDQRTINTHAPLPCGLAFTALSSALAYRLWDGNIKRFSAFHHSTHYLGITRPTRPLMNTSPLITQSAWRWLLALLSLLVSIPLCQHYLQIGTNAVARPITSDFYKFYLSAQRIQQGYSMYWLVPPKLRQGDPCHRDTPAQAAHLEHPEPSLMNLGGPEPCLGPNLNPPVFMVLMQPLLSMPYAKAWWAWAGLSSLCVMLSAWLLVGRWVQRAGHLAIWTLVGSTAMFMLYPTLANFTLGQVGTLLLLLLVLTWRLAYRQQLWQAGCVLGLAISLKPFLGTLLLALAVARQWRALTFALITVACLAGVGAWAYGADAYLQYMQVAKNITWTAANWNASWYGWFDRYFISRAGSDWPASARLSWWLATACAAATLLTAGFCIHRTSHQQPDDAWDAIFALGIPASLLVSPLGWAYYLPMLALSGIIAWRHAPDSARRMALWLPVAMCLVPVDLQASPSPLQPAYWLGLDSLFGYTLLLHFGINLGAMAIKSR
jgi:hypothetical protein